MFSVLLLAAAAASAPIAPVEQQAEIYPASYFSDVRPQSALDIVLRVPGFALNKGEVVRGFAGGGGNVFINGERPASKTDVLEEVLKRIPAASVVRVEVTRGSAPKIDMQGHSVVANLVLRDEATRRSLAAITNSFSIDGRQVQGARFDTKTEAAGRTLEVSISGGEGFDDRSGEGARLRTDAAGRPLIAGDISAKGTGGRYTLTGAYAAPALGGKFRANGRLFSNPAKAVESQELDFPGPATERTTTKRESTLGELGARFVHDLGSSASVDWTVIGQLQNYEAKELFAAPTLTSAFELERNTGELLGRAELSYRPGESLTVRASAEGVFNWLESETRLRRNGSEIPVPAANVRVEEQRFELAAGVSWQARPDLTFEAGLRMEASSLSSTGDVDLDKALSFPKPRLVVAWEIDPIYSLRLRVERVVGQLKFEDFVASSSLSTGVVLAGNPNLEPQQEDLIEAAFQRRFLGAGLATITVKHAWITDVVDRTPVMGLSLFDAPGNIGDGRLTELGLNLTVPLDQLGVPKGQLKGLIVRRYSSVVDPTTAERREISALRPLEWELHFSQAVTGKGLNWGVDVVGGWRETSYRFNEIDTRKLKTWVVPFLEVKRPGGLVVRAEIQNITSRGVRRTRSVYAGLRAEGQLLYVDDRDVQLGPFYSLSIRKPL